MRPENVVPEITPEICGGEILERYFNPDAFLCWDFLAENRHPYILYYPTAGSDLRPLLYANKHFIKSTVSYNPESRFQHPNLFIFSDYYPWYDVAFW